MNIKSSDEHMEPIEDLVNPRAIDFYAESGHVYFADTTSFLIGRQKIDGSGRETILKDGEAECSSFFLVLFPEYLIAHSHILALYHSGLLCRRT